MAIIIISILLVGAALIVSENFTNVNKSAVAVFSAAIAWVLYICYGYDFVDARYHDAYLSFLDGAPGSSMMVKEFIASNIFIKYVGRAAEIVLFLLATMTIVEILVNNGCFDFFADFMKTKRRWRLLWITAILTFIVSANLDNLSTMIIMIVVMHKIVANRLQRMILSSVILISANCGGALTVIGDPTGLLLWNTCHVTATNYSLSLLMPILCAWLIPVYLLGRMLPDHIDIESYVMPYRGDATNLNTVQRLIMLLVGIGGLWFIPTFHNITRLSPFLGALCVLAVLWVVNEFFNRTLLRAEDNIQRRIPRVLQYGVLQMIMYVMGLLLALGVVVETGFTDIVSSFFYNNINNVWIDGVLAGSISVFVDNILTSFTFITINPPSGVADYAQNGIYWKIIAYTTATAGNIFLIGSIGGLALKKTENLRLGWYFRNVGVKCLIGCVVGYIVMILINIL